MLLIFRVCHKMCTDYLLSVNEFSLAMNFLQSFSLRSQNGSWMENKENKTEHFSSKILRSKTLWLTGRQK